MAEIGKFRQFPAVVTRRNEPSSLKELKPLPYAYYVIKRQGMLELDDHKTELKLVITLMIKLGCVSRAMDE